MVQGWLENRRFWRRLRRLGRVVQWTDVERQITAGGGTLLVEISPKGPSCAWLIDRSRRAIDPEAIVPSWHDYEERGWEAFESCGLERLDRWMTEQLQPFESSARALVPQWSQLAVLPAEIKREAVLVTFGWRRVHDQPGRPLYRLEPI
jgi:hypothetical protein